MPQTVLTDECWMKLKLILRDARVYDKPGLRMKIEGMLYRIRNGCPWRSVPSGYGNWNAIFKLFNNWSKNDKLHYAFKILSREYDREWAFIDSSVSRAHQHSAGAAKKSGELDHGIGRGVGGLGSKIHLVADSSGNPINFEITGAEIHDSTRGPSLIKDLPRSDYVIADKGYDSEDFRQQIRLRKSIPVIPRKQNSKTGNKDIDWGLYKYRHLVENAFARLKHFRGIATRFDKLKRNFEGAVALACCFIWLPL